MVCLCSFPHYFKGFNKHFVDALAQQEFFGTQGHGRKQIAFVFQFYFRLVPFSGSDLQ